MAEATGAAAVYDHGRLFRYRAVEIATGRRHTGEQRGHSAYDVRANLRRIGLEIDHLEEVVAADTTQGWRAAVRRALDARACRRRRVAKADLCDGLATLLQAGVPLEQAVTSLAATGTRPVAERRLLETLRDRLRSGSGFAAAVADHPGWFERFDIALLEAGQQAGDLINTLLSLSLYHQRAGAMGQKLLVALAYPVVLVIAGIGAVEFMSFQTLPPLVDMIVQARREPPWLTTTVMGIGQGIAFWWPVVLIAVGALVIGFRRWVGRVPVDSRLGRLVYGNVLARMRGRVRVAHLAMALARLRRAGMPLADALLVVSDTVEDRALRQLLAEAVEALRRGEDLSSVLGTSPLLDPEFAQLLHLGERSGELTEMLERIAERYQRAADRVGERLGAILGPVAIIVLACLIGTVVMASVLPLMQLGELV
jgi:general secretion pathway protein F